MNKFISSSNQISISKKQDILLIPITEFFSDPKNIDLLLGILITGKHKISLRIIDWFVTNYSKKYNTSYIFLRNGENISYFPFKSYKSQLKAYSKKFCDPFCRRERVVFDYRNNVILNFNPNINVTEAMR